ncbi:hypothetical protein V3317_02180 [Mycoplasmopsis felis]
MYSSYKEIQENLNNCKIKNFDFKKTRIYEYLLKNNFDINKIYKSNFTSMCMKNNPTLIRIRNDKFLLCASNKEQSILIVPIKINNKIITLIFYSKSFYGYNFSTQSSNSFITFDFFKHLMNNFQYIENDTVLNYYLQSKQKIKYLFYITVNNNFDEKIFKRFINDIDSMELNSYGDNLKNKYVPIISKTITKEIREYWNNKCAMFYSLNKDYRCPIKIIDEKLLEKYELNYTDIHHLIPKYYFLNYYDLLKDIPNWQIIHSKLNLIPLCSICHQGIHKSLMQNDSNNLLTNIIINELINLKTLLKKDIKIFINFLTNNTDIQNLENLIKEYKRIEWKK